MALRRSTKFYESKLQSKIRNVICKPIQFFSFDKKIFPSCYCAFHFPFTDALSKENTSRPFSLASLMLMGQLKTQPINIIRCGNEAEPAAA